LQNQKFGAFFQKQKELVEFALEKNPKDSQFFPKQTKEFSE
jgi:hypothetical protein